MKVDWPAIERDYGMVGEYHIALAETLEALAALDTKLGKDAEQQWSDTIDLCICLLGKTMLAYVSDEVELADVKNIEKPTT